MPELAEVEYARKQWDAGLGQKISAVELHAEKRIFRETDTRALVRRLTGARYVSSVARGKQMLFRFSGDNSLGLHLGMTGSLRIEKPEFRAEKHDHLVLRQRKQALVFRDPRQFGRVRFHHEKSTPGWWSAAPEIGSEEFTSDYFDGFLTRHRRAPIKAVLLLQSGFPGVGNWMADEILWRAKVAPARRVEALTAAQRTALRRATRFVSREALRVIGHDNADLPPSWLIHERWSAKGVCPRHQTILKRAAIGGRTTAWCTQCQPR
ncbi:MAG: Fpg/Nei family DNA glycosylase [Verrucomicrobiota bacterium]|nr:Fpg/Nei family DNA glycosylase [Verrucomicrobiota bacterium]